jgi:DDE superfamily endonuclease
LKAHRSRLVRDYLDSIGGEIQIAFLPPYAPDLNPVEYLWAWLKRHAMANYCPNDLAELHATSRNKLKSAQKRPSISPRAGNRPHFGSVVRYGTLNSQSLPQNNNPGYNNPATNSNYYGAAPAPTQQGRLGAASNNPPPSSTSAGNNPPSSNDRG